MGISRHGLKCAFINILKDNTIMINEQIVYFRKGMEAVSMNQVDVLELKSLIFEKKYLIVLIIDWQPEKDHWIQRTISM